MEAAEILKSIAARKSETRWGIGTAAQYLQAIAPCLGDTNGICPTDIFEKATPELWQKALNEAAERLTYCDEEMTIDTKSVSRDFDRKTIAVKNAILTFDHVLTSSKKDRDGDILEPEGAEIDEAMPLLWQHIPLQPIGTYLGTTKRTSSTISGKSAILDTSLGRDAAVLVEGGALRISQGFKPYKAEQLYRKDQTDLTPYGFRVQKFGIMEVSLVSVPANTDAVITAYSRKQLNNPLVKSWAGKMYEGRPVIVGGVTLETKDTKTACNCGGNVKVATEIESGNLSPGSGTLDTKAATAANDASLAKQFTCSKCSTKFDLTGVPDGADLSKVSCPMCGGAASAGKAAGDLETKAGKVFSKKNYDRIKQAHGHLADCMKEMGDYEPVDNDSNTNKLAGELVTKQVSFAGSLDTKAIGGESDYVSGSYEWIGQMLNRDAKRFLKESGELPKYGDYYPYIAATFGDSAVIAVNAYSDGRYETTCYSAAWSLVDGKPKFSGEITEVKIEATVSAKSFELFKKAAASHRGDLADIAQPEPATVKSFIAECLKSSDESRLAEAKRDISEALSLIQDQRDAEEMRKLIS